MSSWNLNLDKVNFYAYWEKVFSEKECEKIIKIAKKKGLSKGKIIGNDKNFKHIRKNKICWLYPEDELEWAFQRIADVVVNLNERYFKFDIFDLGEGFQFTNYKSPSDKYGKHIDRSYNFVTRKLSISIQLTKPEKYEGGELYLYGNEKGELMSKEQGTLVLFPSYTLHEVKPVTKGERNALVSWVSGKQFK